LHDTHSSDYRGQTGEVRGSWSSGTGEEPIAAQTIPADLAGVNPRASSGERDRSQNLMPSRKAPPTPRESLWSSRGKIMRASAQHPRGEDL
jgi:hypothetical protein